MSEDKTEWFVNENIILGIPNSDISQEAKALIQESINFLDEFIALTGNAIVIAPFIGILVLIMSSSPDFRGISEEYNTLLDKYEASVSEKFDLVNDKFLSTFLSDLIKRMGK